MLEPDRRLAALGWSDALREAFLAVAPPPGAEPALVARVDLGALTVVTAAGPRRATLGRHAGRAVADTTVCTGDWVAFADGVVVGRLPRRSVLMRRAAGLAVAGQAVAANVDLVLITVPLGTEVRLRRVERGLAVAWSSGARPVVLLTKCDLSQDVEAEVAAVRAIASGADVLAVGRDDPTPMRLRELLAPRTVAVLIGPSGSGKSTLVNRLAGTDLLQTAPVRTDGKGRHTTTHRELIELPGGGLMIDTPGTRELGLWDAGAGIDEVFADLTELAAGCRFRDCRHDREPGCAVRGAAAEDPGVLLRLASRRRLEREQARLDDALTIRAAAEGRREHRRRASTDRQ